VYKFTYLITYLLNKWPPYTTQSDDLLLNNNYSLRRNKVNDQNYRKSTKKQVFNNQGEKRAFILDYAARGHDDWSHSELRLSIGRRDSGQVDIDNSSPSLILGYGCSEFDSFARSIVVSEEPIRDYNRSVAQDSRGGGE